MVAQRYPLRSETLIRGFESRLNAQKYSNERNQPQLVFTNFIQY